jgi:hypothetical protein
MRPRCGAPPVCALGLLVGLSACAHAPQPRSSGPTVEVTLDDGRAAERPLTPGRAFEILIKMDPSIPSYAPRRLRFQLAQAGRLAFTIYGTGGDGGPGAALAEIDRVYEPSLTSSGKDGKWVLEELKVPTQHAPIWIGIHGPVERSRGFAGNSDPRLWASSRDSGLVFQRDPDPSTPLSATRVPRTPMVRVEVEPAP